MFGNKDEEMKKDIGILKEEIKALSEEMKKVETGMKEIGDYLDVHKEWIEGKEFEFKSRIYGFENIEDFQKLSGICSEIANKDSEFHFSLDLDSQEIVLSSNDKNALHKKSLWLINKTEIQNLKYKVS
jgi:hypothetical protein